MRFRKKTYYIFFSVALCIAFTVKTSNVYSQEKLQFLIQRFDSFSEIITKKTTEKELKAIKYNLERLGVSFNYSNLKYNSKKEIISINIKLRNRKSEFSSKWIQKNIPIPDIQIAEINGIVSILTNVKKTNLRLHNNTP